MVEHPKGTESLTIHMVRVLSLWSSLLTHPYQSSPLKGALAHSTVKERDGVTHYSYGEGPLPMVERLRSLTVEPAYASLSVEPPKGSLRDSYIHMCEGFIARPTEEVEGRHHAPGRARGEGKTCYCRLEREADNA
jgi:hypothetical protein